ncbi:hypothetical protein [Fodinicola feengrottensis]|uniref:hypothetical protein n=1 Tax=Fodinicola feengrottensis TaxID=435914 RepID=UPI00244193E8|nr:hypothetical protein [Fodinicola feengrottensis]
MTAVVSGTAGDVSGGWTRGLWHRQLDHYPSTGKRMLYLSIVVIATVVLYYELYVGGAVAPAIIAHYHMSFPYYVYISVFGNLIGASPRSWPDWPIAGGGRTWSRTASR